MLKTFSEKKQEIDEFLFALEKFTNIAAVKASRFENKTVLEILDTLQYYVLRFYKLKNSDNKKYVQLLISFESYKKKPKLLQPSQRFDTDGEKQAKKSAFILIDDDIEQNGANETDLFNLFLGHFWKIWESAIKVGNDEISRHSIYRIEFILACIAEDDNNVELIRTILQLLNRISYLIFVKYSGNVADTSIFPASINWYINIVFYGFGKRFNLRYLHYFNIYFLESAKTIISYGRFEVFQHLVSMLTDGISFSSNLGAGIWDYGHLIMETDFKKYEKIEEEYKVEEKLRNLDNLSKNIYSMREVEQCKSLFGELKNILEPYFNEQQKEYAIQIEQEIMDGFEDQIKFNSIIEIAFAIGSYCLFKEKPAYIRYMWEYKQPADSDAFWSGHDITPTTINGLMKFYFSKGFFERRWYRWEGHHGQEIYFNRYFVLVLARVIKYDGRLYEPQQFEINRNKFRFLKQLDKFSLQNLKQSTSDFISIVNQLCKDVDLLRELNFTESDVDLIFSKKIIEYLKQLGEEADKESKDREYKLELSITKIEEFREDLISTFTALTTFRRAFHDFNILEKSDDINRELNLFGANRIEDKAVFFEDWHVQYTDWGKNYGRDIAENENLFLYSQLVHKCDERTPEEFEQVLHSIPNPDDIIIITSNAAAYEFEKIEKKFKPIDRGDALTSVRTAHIGSYQLKSKLIPVYRFLSVGLGNVILILNSSRFGKFIQYPPTILGTESDLSTDLFYINIQAYSENPELLDSIIKNPPDWLKDMGNEEEQRDYLNRKVWIRIFEKFELKLSPDFEGYVIKLLD